MGKIAFVFAGQGAQHTGMGSELFRNSNGAAEIFRRADQVRPGTSEQCFNGSSEELAETKNTQPCVYTVDIAAAEALSEHGIKADLTAGYSLGELAALAYAGAYSFEDGLELVVKRGELMQQASEESSSGMMAVLKLDDDKVEEIASGYSHVYPVNFNCRGQITVAGEREQLSEFGKEIKSAGGLVRVLQVSGGFHSPFMEKAGELFDDELAAVDINDAAIPVFSNWTAEEYRGDYKRTLVKQITNPIRWKILIENMINRGADTFIELGPGTALSKMISRISEDVSIYHVNDIESLEKTVEEVRKNAQR